MPFVCLLLCFINSWGLTCGVAMSTGIVASVREEREGGGREREGERVGERERGRERERERERERGLGSEGSGIFGPPSLMPLYLSSCCHLSNFSM